jgi:hypothetical protein
MRIRAHSTNACKVIVRTSGSMNIETDISPANVRRWIDTATAYAAATPHRTKGQRIRYAWIPIRLGISRTITDRFDAFEFATGGHGIPIVASEIQGIARRRCALLLIRSEPSSGVRPPHVTLRKTLLEWEIPDRAGTILAASSQNSCAPSAKICSRSTAERPRNRLVLLPLESSIPTRP